MKTRVLVLGESGLVGSHFISFNKDIFDIDAPTLETLDALNTEQLKKYIKNSPADLVINFIAYTDVKKAQEEDGNKEGIVYALNSLLPKNLAAICQEFNKHLVHISTEYVFDGTKADSPYTEADLPSPINWYGATKSEGDKYIAESGCKFVIARISMPFAANYSVKKDIARFYLEQLQAGNKIKAITDAKNTPLFIDDLSLGLRLLISNSCQGVYNLSSLDAVTPFEFATLIAQKFNFDTSLIEPINFEDYNRDRVAKLLKNSWLSPQKFVHQFPDTLHTVSDEVEMFFKLKKL